MEGFEIQKSTRRIPTEYVDVQQVDVTRPANGNSPSTGEIVARGFADNIPAMIDLAKDIVSIEKMKAATDGQVRILQEKRKELLDEAEAYVRKQNADTNKMISKGEQIRLTLEQVFSRVGDKMSGEDLAKTISTIVESMSGKL